jgi:hypothetical protein
MSGNTDLLTRLHAAVTAALDDLRPDLERDPQSIRGVTIELTIGPGGWLADAVSFVERRKKAAQLGLLDHPKVRVG